MAVLLFFDDGSTVHILPVLIPLLPIFRISRSLNQNRQTRGNDFSMALVNTGCVSALSGTGRIRVWIKGLVSLLKRNYL